MPQINWDELGQAFQDSREEGKGIFVRIEDKDELFPGEQIARELVVYWVEPSDETLDLFDYLECHMWGTFDEEMIVSDDSLISWDNLDDDDQQRVVAAILDRANWRPIKFAEVEDDYPISHPEHTDRMYIVKEGQELPRGATGKFLVQGEDENFSYEDGSPIIPNDKRVFPEHWRAHYYAHLAQSEDFTRVERFTFVTIAAVLERLGDDSWAAFQELTQQVAIYRKFHEAMHHTVRNATWSELADELEKHLKQMDVETPLGKHFYEKMFQGRDSNSDCYHHVSFELNRQRGNVPATLEKMRELVAEWEGHTTVSTDRINFMKSVIKELEQYA